MRGAGVLRTGAGKEIRAPPAAVIAYHNNALLGSTFLSIESKSITAVGAGCYLSNV